MGIQLCFASWLSCLLLMQHGRLQVEAKKKSRAKSEPSSASCGEVGKVSKLSVRCGNAAVLVVVLDLLLFTDMVSVLLWGSQILKTDY